MAQPLGLVGVVLQTQARHEGLVAAHDHHDEQVGDHDHVNQCQNHQHDDGLVERGHRKIAFVANAGHQFMQRLCIAEHRLDQMDQLHPEVEDIHRLRQDQAQIQRHLQPAAGKNQGGQWPHGRGFGGCG
ncbi:hypothetical protein D3C72_1824280 [compost metagenome]